jgi:hypothetical protein
MYALAKQYGGLEVTCRPEVTEIFDLIPSTIPITRVADGPAHYNLMVGPNHTSAYWYAHKHNLHMTQAHFPFLDLDPPAQPIRPELNIDLQQSEHIFDFVLSPFSVSLPAEQLWQDYKWIDLVRSLPEKSFLVIGAQNDYLFSPLPRIIGKEPNVTLAFGLPLREVAKILLSSGVCVSVVNGISHLSYALGTKNVLLFDQDLVWGKNPDAQVVQGPVYRTRVEEVIKHCIMTTDLVQ